MMNPKTHFAETSITCRGKLQGMERRVGLLQRQSRQVGTKSRGQWSSKQLGSRCLVLAFRRWRPWCTGEELLRCGRSKSYRKRRKPTFVRKEFVHQQHRSQS